MKKGKYKDNNTNFALYKADYFRPYLFFSGFYESFGCGPCTLSLLTGLSPTSAILRVDPRNTSDKSLLKALAECEIQNFPITKCEMTNDPVSVASSITNQHVLLLSQLWRRNEASWGVMYNDVMYHNFKPCSVSNLDFLNRPILSAYVLFKPEWLEAGEYLRRI
jgi:hypothetical protein